MKEHDIVFLIDDWGIYSKKTPGCIVYCYKDISYVEVEFFDDSNNTIAIEFIHKDLLTIEGSDLYIALFGE